ncbi:hypothetical protein V8D89_003475 [Ganoderma adspersum]
MSQLTNTRPRDPLALPYDVENGYNEYVLEDFRQVLRESLHLAKFIRTIRIDGGRCRIPHIASFVRHILRRALHLHTMTLSAMLVKPDVVFDMACPRASIDTLNLWGLGFTKPDALLRIFGNFTRIGQLYIFKCEEISRKATEPGFSVSPSIVPVVESVALADVPTYLLELLQSVLCMSSLDDGALTSMDISIAKPCGVSTFLLPCLEYARNHIIALDLDVHQRMFEEYPETFAEPWHALASCIASCTALEFLGFSNVLEAYVRLLRSLPPSMLSIEFTVRQRSADGAGTVQAILGAVAGGKRQWGGLDAALSASPLHTFLDFLDGTSDIAGYVHNVRVRSGQGFLLSLGSFIPLLLLKAPRLRTLTMFSLSLGRRDESRLPPAVDPPAYDDRQFSRIAIDTLDISSCYFHGLRPLYDILRPFSRIGQLNIQGSNAKPTHFPASHHLLPFLHSIFRTSSLSNSALKSIRCLASKDTLEHFLVPCLEDECGHLRELHLDIESYTFDALESITVTVDGDRGAHRVSSAYVNALRAVLWTSAHLVCPPPPSVRSIVLTVRESFDPDDAEDADHCSALNGRRELLT